MVEDPGGQRTGLSLHEVAAQRDAEAGTRDGKSGDTLYHVKYHKDDPETVKGKSTEIGPLDDTDRIGLNALDEDVYTYYAIFRLRDRSTVTLIQDNDGDVYKVLTLGASAAQVSCPATISIADDG